MNWKIKSSDNYNVIAESEKVKYKLDLNGFNIEIKDQNTLRSILNNYRYFRQSQRRIDLEELNSLIAGIQDGFITMGSFRWLNTWIVTKGDSWQRGKRYANFISNELFGLTEYDIPRIAGEEDGNKYYFTNSQIFSILKNAIYRKFKNK